MDVGGIGLLLSIFRGLQTKVKRFLITTALEETWVDNEPVLFLGDWCRLYSRQNRWSGMDAKVLPYHWDDQDKFQADYQYLSSFYERLLVLLAQQLNQIHSVDKELRYWRILIGPWLAYFVQMLFDRWSSIQLAVSRFEISGTTIIVGGDSLVPNDMEHFTQLFVGDEWNHHICAVVLEQSTKVPCIRKAYKGCAAPTEANNVGLKNKLAAIYAKLATPFVRDSDALLIGTYVPVIKTLRLQLRFGQVPQIWQPVSPIRVPIDWSHREWIVSGQAKNDFEQLVLDMIPRQMPSLYLEGYQQLTEQVRGLPWPKNPRLIFTSNLLWHDTVAMAYTAQKATQGTPLVYGQHGGVYGVAKFTWAEEHEVVVSDQYLTWGWIDEYRPKIKALGILKAPKTRRRAFNAKKRLLLVTLESSRYTYRLSSESLVLSNNYINNCFLFAEGLPNSIQQELLVRLAPTDYGWNQFARWKDRFPGIDLDPGLRRIHDLRLSARIAVYTYNSTGFLEAFAENIPSVLFWDPRVSALRESAIPYFEDLKRVGIFHDTPESAARHVVTIWDDVDSWWLSPVVQGVLERFKARHCHVVEDVVGCIEHALTEAMAALDDSATK